MQNSTRKRRGKVAAIFLALLVTATAVPAISVAAISNTDIQDVAGGGNTTTTNGDDANTPSLQATSNTIISVTVPDTIEMKLGYDVQRRSGGSGYPKLNDNGSYADMECYSATNPYQDTDITDTAVSYKLVKKGKYSEVNTQLETENKTTTTSHKNNVLNGFETAYELSKPDNLIIYELQGVKGDGNTYHIAYGVVTTYVGTKDDQKVFFIGWSPNGSNEYGYLFTDKDFDVLKDDSGNVIVPVNVYPVADDTYNAIKTAPVVNTGLVYNGADQQLLASGGELSDTYKDDYQIQYKLANKNEWVDAIDNDKVKAWEAGTYTVQYRVVKTDDNTVLGNVKELEVTINKAIVTPPTALNPTYNGDDQQLLASGGELSDTYKDDYKIQYKLANKNDWVDTIDNDKVKAWEAGTYTVQYRVVKTDDDDTVLGSVEQLEVTIKQAEVTVNPPTPATQSLFADGEPKTLANKGSLECTATQFTSADYGYLYYAVTSSGEDAPYGLSSGSGEWKDNIDTKTEAGTYKVWWGIHNASSTSNNFKYLVNGTEVQPNTSRSIDVEIKAKQSALATEPEIKTGLVYNGSAQELVTEGQINADAASSATIKYAVTAANETTAPEGGWNEDIPTETNAGTYKVWYRVEVGTNSNYSGVNATEVGTVTIEQAEVTVNPPTALNPTYNGSEQDIAELGRLSCDAVKIENGQSGNFNENDYGQLIYRVTKSNETSERQNEGVTSSVSDATTWHSYIDQKKEEGDYKVWWGVQRYKGPGEYEMVSNSTGNFKYVVAGSNDDNVDFNSDDWVIDASIAKQTYVPGVTTYSVTFNSNGGTPVATQWVTSGGKLTAQPTSQRDGYTLEGWYTDEALTQRFDFSTAITKNTVLYAKWKDNNDATDPDGAILGQVTGLKAVKKTTTTLKLSFNKVSGATGYEIYDAKTNTLLATCSTQKGAEILKKTITGLNPGEVREYKVRAYVTADGTRLYGAFSKVYKKATAERTPALMATAVKTTNTAIKLEWTPVEGAAQYLVYGGSCSTSATRLKRTYDDQTTWTHKNLEKASNYKYYVVALDEHGEKMATSPTIHVATNGGAYGNATALTLNSDAAIQMEKGGKVANVLTELTAAPNNKQPLTHKAALRYRSDDKTVAKVDQNGVITAVNKGTCTIYVYAQNGLYQAVTVTVE